MLLEKSAAEMASGIRRRYFTATEVITASLARADAVQGRLNAFTSIDHDGAQEAARQVDMRLNAGETLPPLAGVPVVIKDMTPTVALPTTLGSWTTGAGHADHDALIVMRLKSAGAIVIGKSTTPEFAYSSFTRSRRYGVTRNPWNEQHTPGGSSGGSAVAVATGVAPFAEGSDMGGSIRIPAAACGIVGFKPSLGRIPMTILRTPIDTMSHLGPLAISVDDVVQFITATAGPSDFDLLSQITPFRALDCTPVATDTLRFAISMDLDYFAVSGEVVQQIDAAVAELRIRGAAIEPVSLGWTPAVMDCWLDKWAALLSLFLVEVDAGAREQMDPALLRLVERAEKLSATQMKQGERLQLHLAETMARIFEKYDALLCPTNAITAPKITSSDSEFEIVTAGKLHGFDMTHPFNLVPTYPAISLPAGLARSGLPVGLQVVGPRYRDERLLAIAGAIERTLTPLPRAPWPGVHARSVNDGSNAFTEE